MADMIFRRREQKYQLDAAQAAAFRQAMAIHMEHDQYATSDIRNIYYDTADYRLIRRSLEKPEYKEKLRLRAYGDVGPENKVFLEMKKKYKGVVYKRRIRMTAKRAQEYMADPQSTLQSSQIGREIDYFKMFYKDLRPAVYLSYDRESWRSHDGQLRITLDWNVLYRTEDMDLTKPRYGTALLPDGMHLLEIKTPEAIPLWLVEVLNRNAIRKCSFSKYGNVYLRLLKEYQMESRGLQNV